MDTKAYKHKEKPPAKVDGLNYLGQNSLHLGLSGPKIEDPADPAEVILRLALKAKSKDHAQRFLRLIPPLALNGPPGMAGFSGIPSPRELVRINAYLLSKTYVDQCISVTVKEVG